MLPVFLCGLGLLVYLIFPSSPLNVLVVGVDSRPGEGYLSRTDSNILVGIQPSHLRVSLLSIPRDLSIEVPGYGLQHINTANMLGEEKKKGSGPELLSAAISKSFGIQTERYVRMNFQGFVDIINAVGGVTITVDKTLVDYQYPTANYGTISVRFDPGTQHMDGERALIYARTRHADDDYQRANRQQQVIAALSVKLLNPLTWPAVVAALNRSVDTNLTVLDMAKIAPAVLLNAGRFDRKVIDRSLITATAQGVAIPNYKLLAPWIDERFK